MKRALGIAGTAALLASAGMVMAPAQAAPPDSKVTVCHVTGHANSADSDNSYDWTIGREITVSQSALAAHEAHGDRVKPDSGTAGNTYITPAHPWWQFLTDTDGSMANGNCAFR